MELRSGDRNNLKNYLDDDVKLINTIDLAKIRAVLRKSLIWVVGIFSVCVIAAYLFIRWSIPVYESSSELKLDTKSEASILSLNTISQSPNYANISGEIELLKSRLFFSKVIEATDIDISYFAIGNVRTDERYVHSPFVVTAYEVDNPWYYDRKFYVELIDSHKVKVTYPSGDSDISRIINYGDSISAEGFTVALDLRGEFQQELQGTRHYFIINSYNSLVNYLRKNLTVEPQVLDANTIKVSFRAYNQFKARDLVNAIDTLYLNYTAAEKNKANEQKIAFLNEQLRVTEQRLEDFENYIENFTVSNKTINLDNDLKQTIEMINRLDSQRFYLSNRIRVTQELKDAFLTEDQFVLTPGQRGGIPPSLIETVEHYSTLTNEKDLLLTNQNENTYAVRRKLQQINELRKDIQFQLEELISSLNLELNRVTTRKEELEADFALLPSKNTNFAKIQRYYELYEEFYLTLMQNKAEFQIAQAGTTTDFKILSTATLPEAPIHPNTPYVMAIGVIMGLVLSFAFVSVRYLTHNRVNTAAEIERATNAPFLGSVPYYNREIKPDNRLVISSNAKSAVSEAFRSLRTNLSFMSAGEELKVISVSSTVGSEGKTFVSVNLGGVIALSQKKVVLVDLDMRKPKIHLAFPKGNCTKGVSTILSKQSVMEESIQHTSLENLDFIAAGPTPPNPSELILNMEFDRLIRKLKEKYDMVILDTPPTGLVTDGVLAMQRADLPVYILRADFSKKSYIQNINRLMEMNNFRNLAIVLNAVKTRQGDGYGYGYGYYEEERSKMDFLKVWRRASV